MALELANVSRIDTPQEARAHARRWDRMAREIDTPDAPDQAKDKARELRQRSKAANDWARREEDALLRGRQAHDTELAKHKNNVVQLHPEQRAEHSSRARKAARRAGHAAYHAAKPPAMRIVHRGRQHFFQGLSEPFGPVGSGWDLALESLGVTLAIVILADLLRAPRAITEGSQHAVGAIERWVGVADPITGLTPARAAAHGSSRPAPASARKKTNVGTGAPAGVVAPTH